MSTPETMEGLPFPHTIHISEDSTALERQFGKMESGRTAQYLLMLWRLQGNWNPLSPKTIGADYLRYDVGFELLKYGEFIQLTETGHYAPTRGFVERCVASVSAPVT